MLVRLTACVALAAALVAGAGAAPPKKFAPRVDNPWFPLVPGTTFVYRGTSDGHATRDVVTVTHRTKMIAGVRCTVVDDRVYEDGRLAERTTDWYAQDAGGTVGYFGEATAELDEHGKVTSTEGSWEAGRGGARAGIFMPARPRAGQSFRQEYLRGHAEDWFRVLNVSARVRVPYTSSRHALLTKEWTPLEPGVVDHKVYVRGVGLVQEASVKGGHERLALVSVRR
jgi:hypothetical protein